MKQYVAWLPEIFLSLAGMALFTVDICAGERRKYIRHLALLALAVFAGLSGWLLQNAHTYYGLYFNGAVRLDAFTSYGRLIFAAAGAMIILASWRFYGEESNSEYYGLLLFSFLGGSVIISAQSLLVLFLGIELLALPTYTMVAILKKQKEAVEAGLKYFLLGAFASIALLYGMSLMYGVFGTISYMKPLFANPATLAPAKLDLLSFAFLLVFMGIGFKIVAFPFHFWSPDVYSGGSTPVVSYISTMPKVAMFLALYRIIGPDFAVNYPSLQLFIGILAVLSMTYGNVVALMQDDVRRMLAYSGIANTGYALIALVIGGKDAYTALLFFLLFYVFGTLGAFFVVLGVSGQEQSKLTDFSGLAKRSPFLAMAMTICILSLAGTPPLAGFFGKFVLFKSAVTQGFPYLAFVGLVNSVISLGYYLRIAQQMYIAEPSEIEIIPAADGTAVAGGVAKLAIPVPLTISVSLAALGTVALGFAGIGWITQTF